VNPDPYTIASNLSFDAIVTFSSVEHSGLGRYGDALNPWGDIIAIARAWCITKQGGSLTIGVMYAYDNDDIISPYSSVTISLAPASKTQASTQGFSEPITKTHPLLTPGACCNPSLNKLNQTNIIIPPRSVQFAKGWYY
jgi:hypothetical protein